MLSTLAVSPQPVLAQFPHAHSDSQTHLSEDAASSTAQLILGAEQPTPAPAPSPPASASNYLEGLLADRQNLRNLAQKLYDTAAYMGVNAPPQAILAALNTTPMDVHPDSSLPVEENRSVTLKTYITTKGLAVPTSHFGLTALAEALLNRAMEHPLGNFGGGLSWPLPMSIDAQHTLADTVSQHLSAPSTPPQDRVELLEYLNDNQPLSSAELDNPAKALEAVVCSARAQALGHAIQTRLKGIATDTSVNDYILAALNISLDPPTEAAPPPNTVAGFDLAQQKHWGKPASAILASLSTHLIDTGKATPAMANVGAYLLLARKAPELLIKDIPASVTYGSPAWLNVSIAAATIEAQTPGKVPNMSFSQVMLAAENANLQDQGITQQAQRDALRVWGVINGVISQEEAERYSEADIEKVKTAFNQQANERIEASHLTQTEIPSRRDIALAKLKERFGEGVPFEEKLMTVVDNGHPLIQPLYDPNRPPAGQHSLLDIAMSGLHNVAWETNDQCISDAIQGKSLQFDVNAVFKNQLNQAIDSRKKGIGTTVKQLIAQLPLVDRQNLEYAKLEFYQNNTYQLGLGFSGRTLAHKNDTLLVKATGVNGQTVYAINLKQGSITQVANSVLSRERERNANRVYPIEKCTPTKASEQDLSQDITAGIPLPIPASFSSARTQSIADVIVKHLDIDNNDVITEAEGSSTYDKQLDVDEKLADFFLNLLPLRSAIVNFSNGNYVDGAMDLGMDLFGFITAGAGAVAKVAKVGAKAISMTTKAMHVAKILGTTVIGELNPVGGLGNLIDGGVKLIGKGIDKLRTAGGAYDVAKAISSEYGPITHGTFKVAGQTFQGDTLVSNGKRYAYDRVKMKPYGTPLEDFNPLDTLAPSSPLTHSPRQQHAHRYNPMNTSGRPIRPRKPLPSGDYVESMRGKLEPDHFKPDTKMLTMTKFNDEMNDYYDAIKQSGLPPRPSIPQVPEPIGVSELLTQALQASPGVVLGESHKEMASFRVLFDNVDTLKNQGVKKVYFEGLIDMPQGLVDDGIGLLGQSKLLRTDPTFEQLRKKLGDNGIEVLPIDHHYLTRHKDVRGLLGPTTMGSGSVRRLEEFNYYAAETIQANSGTEKWVALVGHSHMNTSEGVPGLAELTASIGIGVYDNANLSKNVGMRLQGRAPDPSKPVGSGGVPGDLQIYMKP